MLEIKAIVMPDCWTSRGGTTMTEKEFRFTWPAVLPHNG